MVEVVLQAVEAARPKHLYSRREHNFSTQYWPLMADVAKELSLEFATAGVLELLKLLV